MTLTDFVYFSSLNDKSNSILKAIHETNRQKYIQDSLKIWDLNYRSYLLSAVDEDIKFSYSQKDIDSLFTSLSKIFHDCIPDNIREYLYNRKITKEQIDTFKIGSPNKMFSDFNYFKKEVDILKIKHNNILLKEVMNYFFHILKTISEYYQDESLVSFPSFDANGVCKGIVFRTIGYVKKSKPFRNIYKFFNTNPSSYLFNKYNLNKYDTLFLVEGVFDYIALDSIGIDNVITASAVSLSDTHYDLLKNKKLIVIFDNDKGGYYGVKKLNDKLNVIDSCLCNTEEDIGDMSKEDLIEFMYRWKDEVCTNSNR